MTKFVDVSCVGRDVVFKKPLVFVCLEIGDA